MFELYFKRIHARDLQMVLSVWAGGVENVFWSVTLSPRYIAIDFVIIQGLLLVMPHPIILGTGGILKPHVVVFIDDTM